MTKLPITNMKGERVGELELADNLLELKRGAQVVTETVTAFRAGLRAGTASTKVKGDVAGTGAKPFKQKGTGRARAGMRRSPLWKGGGITFGPHPRDFSKHVNKKAGRLAFRRAFSERVAAGEVTVIDEIRLAAPKTREMAALLKGCGAVAGALIVVDRIEDDLQRAARNIQTLSLETASDVNVYGLLRYPRVIVSKAAMAVIEKRLAAPVRRGA